MLNNCFTTPGRQQGLSLVELMIAMTLGLLVIGAVAGVFLSSSRNYAQDERLSRMQENARYALHILAEDLSMGGYWGPLMSGDDINTNNRDCTDSGADSDEQYCQGFFTNSVLTIDKDCAPGTVGLSSPEWAISITNPIEIKAQVTSDDTSDASHPDFNCIVSSELMSDEQNDFYLNSDILVIKRVEGEELASTRNEPDDSGNVFIRTNGSQAMLFEFDNDIDLTQSESADASDWRYIANVYYIQDHFLEDGEDPPIPTLARKRLRYDPNDDELRMDPEEVAQGIEYFHVMFGIDTDVPGDGTANLFKSDPSLDELEDVTAARIHILVRSMSEDPAYENDRTYQLGDVTIDYSANPDGFYRRVFTTTVTLRNQRNRILTTGGS